MFLCQVSPSSEHHPILCTSIQQHTLTSILSTMPQCAHYFPGYSENSHAFLCSTQSYVLPLISEAAVFQAVYEVASASGLNNGLSEFQEFFQAMHVHCFYVQIWYFQLGDTLPTREHSAILGICFHCYMGFGEGRNVTRIQYPEAHGCSYVSFNVPYARLRSI